MRRRDAVGRVAVIRRVDVFYAPMGSLIFLPLSLACIFLFFSSSYLIFSSALQRPHVLILDNGIANG